PRVNADVVSVAVPPESAVVASGVTPSRNVTLPAGVPRPEVVDTVAVTVTDVPIVDGFDELPSVVVVAPLTNWPPLRLPVLARNTASPLYSAVIVCAPGDSADVVSAATPPLSGTGAPRFDGPSLNCTVPVGGPGATSGDTVAVKVTDAPGLDGVPDVTTAVDDVSWLTVMSAVATAPPSPASAFESDARIVTCPVAEEFGAGVNARPALACANVMKSPAAIAVDPSCWNSVPPLIAVTLKCVTSAPSAALRLMTNPDVVCTLTVVAALVIDGVSATGLTVMVAIVEGPTPAPSASVAPWTAKLADPKKFGDGVNFRPAFPSATVMTALSAMTVVPSFLNSVPFAIAEILKCVTSGPSAGLRLSPRPLVVCVSSLVVALVTPGASAIEKTTSAKVSVAVNGVPPIVFVAVTVMVVVPERFSAGVIVSVRVDPLP